MRAKVGVSIAAAGGAGLSLAAKLLISLVATGAIVGTVVAVRSSSSATLEETPRVTVQLQPEEVRPAAVEHIAPEASPPPPAAIEPVEPHVAPVPVTAVATPPPPVVVAAPVHATLAREVELVDTAQAQVRHRELDAALVTLRTYTIETAGRGQLAEDAAAIEVEALCRLANPTATRASTRSIASGPCSAQRARLVEACK